MIKRLVGVNDHNRPVGEDQPQAKLTNAEVELIRELHREGLSYKALAMKFEVSKSSIAMICRDQRRSVVVTRWKVVHGSSD